MCVTQTCMQNWINLDKIVRGNLVCGEYFSAWNIDLFILILSVTYSTYIFFEGRIAAGSRGQQLLVSRRAGSDVRLGGWCARWSFMRLKGRRAGAGNARARVLPAPTYTLHLHCALSSQTNLTWRRGRLRTVGSAAVPPCRRALQLATDSLTALSSPPRRPSAPRGTKHKPFCESYESRVITCDVFAGDVCDLCFS